MRCGEPSGEHIIRQNREILIIVRKPKGGTGAGTAYEILFSGGNAHLEPEFKFSFFPTVEFSVPVLLALPVYRSRARDVRPPAFKAG